MMLDDIILLLRAPIKGQEGRWRSPAAFLLHIQQNSRPFLYLLFDHPQAFFRQIVA